MSNLPEQVQEQNVFAKLSLRNKPADITMDRHETCDHSRLPPEMWIEIFLELDARCLRQVRLVCRRWRDIVDGTSPLLARFTAFFEEHIVDSEFQPLHLLPAKKAWFKTVTITGLGSWWPPFGQRLTEIAIIFNSKIEKSVLVEMLRNTPNLCSLMLGCITVTGESSSHDNLILTKLRRLEIVEDILQVFRGLCAKNLKFLRVPIPSPGYNPSLEISSFVGRFQDTLEELDFTCTDDILREMTKLDRLQLKTLTISRVHQGDSATLIEFLRMQPSLEFLDTRDALMLVSSNQAELNAIGRLLPKLKSFACFLDMHDEGEVDVVDLAFLSSMTNLRTLSIMGAGDDFLFINCVLPNLRVLDISQIILVQGRLPQWFASMPNLHTVCVYGCEFVGSWLDFIEALASLKQLRRLTLDAINVSIETDRDCSFELAHLKYLHLNYMTMPQEQLFAIFDRCSGLRELSFEGMHLSDQALRGICRKLSHVTCLSFEHCNLPSFRGTTVDLAKLVGDGEKGAV